MTNLSDYDYELPEELIASEPCQKREQARLLLVDRQTGRLDHHTVGDVPDLLHPGDALVLNDTRVLPARLFGRRTETGGKWEGLYLGVIGQGQWRLIGQCRGRLKAGEEIDVHPAHHPESAERLRLRLLRQDEEGIWTAEPQREGDVVDLLHRFGTVPLPPYIDRQLATETDWQRYQTTFARRPGAVAAPTAGLHFTPELLRRCEDRGIEVHYVTLHVGIGTFRPIQVEKLEEHRMHGEWCELPDETARCLNTVRQRGGRIIAVGTTTVRTLETAAQGTDGAIQPWQGETDLFIHPPYEFRAVDGLLTNFHLPQSSLLVLVSTFGGKELIGKAYRCAIEDRYRFYSYGDAMLIR